ncbi:hypothetical protein GYB57_09280 [bacterium]|nr:hypothetical protein [bacterium]
MLLKKHISILFLLIGLNGFAQNDTIKITNRLDSNSTQYLTPMEYAFMFHEDTPWMLKAAINSRHSFYLAFEKRIKGVFTANISLEYTDNIGIANLHPINYYLGARLAARYYYKMKQRNKNKNTPFSLSGNYFSLGYDLFNLTRTNQNTSNHNIFIKWGMQRRYLKNGFIDFGLKASRNIGDKNSNIFNISTETSIGVAFAKDQSSLNFDRLCPVIQCHESERSIFKFNLSNILSSTIYNHSASFFINPNLTHELKLGASPFSINNTIDISLNLIGLNKTSFGYINYRFEERYYFNLKNRILKGKAGNGLSAEYLSLGFNNYYSSNSYLSAIKIEKENGMDNFIFLHPQLTIGTQRFVGKHFYYDMSIGMAFPNLIINAPSIYNQSDAELIINNKVGFRF